MRYILLEYDHPQEDEAKQVYSELDRENRETRRVELYPNGLWFAYGDEHGREEALSADPFPEDVRTLNVPGEVSARTIAPGVFREARRLYGHVFLTAAKKHAGNGTARRLRRREDV